MHDLHTPPKAMTLPPEEAAPDESPPPSPLHGRRCKASREGEQKGVDCSGCRVFQGADEEACGIDNPVGSDTTTVGNARCWSYCSPVQEDDEPAPVRMHDLHTPPKAMTLP